MRLPSMLVSLLAVSSMPLVLRAQVSLVVYAGGSHSGTFCDPQSCVPSRVMTPAIYPLFQIQTIGAPFQPTIMLVALPPHQCFTLPGFAGSLMLQPPADAVLINPTWGHMYGWPCASWIGFQSVALPAGLPSSFRFLVQLLAPAPAGWTFSNTVSVTVV